MRRWRSLVALALLGPLACRSPSASERRVTFELATVARTVDSMTGSRPDRQTGDSIPLVEPPLLTTADLLRARSVTRSKWYLLSGSQSTTTLILTLKRTSADRLSRDLDRAVAQGDNLALIVDGQVIGNLFGQVQKLLEQDQLTIDAGYFSAGTPAERKAEATRLARQIQAGIP